MKIDYELAEKIGATHYSENGDYDIDKGDCWTLCSVEQEKVDVNTDPWDDCEKLTTKYTVYAMVDNKEDFKMCEQYQTQYEYVTKLYNDVIQLKTQIDTKLEDKK